MGIPWEIFFPVGVVVLGLVLAWGLLQSRRRNRANDPLTEAATREEYDRPNSYDETEETLRRKVDS